MRLLPRIVVLLAVVMAWAVLAEDEPKVETEVAVRVALIQKATLRAYVTGYGTVEPEPAREKLPAAGAKIASPVAGVLAETKCAEGQRVEKGAVLFRLDSRVATVQIEKAKRTLAFAEQSFERQQKLLKVEGTSQKLLQEAEAQVAAARSEFTAAETQLALQEITAPFAGTITKVNARPGEAVELNTVLAELADLERLVVAVPVPSGEASAIKEGQPAEISFKADAKPVAGRVVSLAPQVDPATGTVLVRVAVPKDAGLRPGQFLNVRIVSEERKDRLAVPVASVVKNAETGAVIAIVENGKATRKPVKAGLRDGGLVEVEGEGLRAGQTVVTAGAYGLPKETKVRVLNAETK